MKRSIKKIKQEAERPLPLVVPDASGGLGITFPGEVIENIRYMLTRVGMKDHLPVCLSIVSALRGEGVTLLAQALAATIANDMRARVCMVVLNWWWPSISPLVDPANPGLAGVLNGNAKLDEVITRTGWPNFSLVPAGTMAQANRPIMARSRLLKENMGELSQRFDYLILDIPAILATNDAVPLASLGAACCLVVKQGVTNVEDVRLALDEIAHLKILGVVLNQVKLAMPKTLVKMISTF